MEPLGLAFGAASLLTLFNTCVDIFKHVKHGRNFGQEYDRRLDMFHMEQRRLDMWGERVAIRHDSGVRAITESDLNAVFVSLRQLERLFNNMKDILRPYEIQDQAMQDRPVGPSRPTPVRSLQAAFSEFNIVRDFRAQQRHSQTSLLKRARYVLNIEKFDKLLGDITFFLNHLVSEEQHVIAIGSGLSSGHGDPHQRRQSSVHEGPGLSCLPGMADSPENYQTQVPTVAGFVSKPSLEGYLNPLQAPPGFDSTPYDLFNNFVRNSVRNSGSLRYQPEAPSDRAPLEASPSPSRGSSSSSWRVSDDYSAAYQCTTTRPRLASVDTAFTAPPSSDWASRCSAAQPPPQPRRGTWAAPNSAASPFSSQLHDNLLPEANCLSSSVDGTRVAYLTASGVYVFDTSSASPRASRLRALGTYQPRGGTWTGVAIAGSYLAVWGPSASPAELLVGGRNRTFKTTCCEGSITNRQVHVAARSDSSSGVIYLPCFEFCFGYTTPTFESEKKVRISRRGLVAFNDGHQILVRSIACPDENISLPFPESKPWSSDAKPPRLLDIAINESGDVLYYWGMGIPQAFLTSWDLTDPTKPNLTSAAAYICDRGQNIHKATLFPYCRRRGCIVGHSNCEIFFPGWVDNIQIKGTVGRRKSDELQLKAKEIQAACVLGDFSLIVLQNPRKSDIVLYEYPIQGSGSRADIKKGQEIGQLRLSTKTSGVLTVSAFNDQDEGVMTVVICGSNGSIEVARLKR